MSAAISSNFVLLGTDASIVVIGAFNPWIIQPYWLLQQGLIDSEDAEKAEAKIIHKRAVDFTFSWANLKVTEDKFAIQAADDASIVRIRDLAQGIFTTLEHCEIKAFGFNSSFIYLPKKKEHVKGFYEYLVPPNPWTSILHNSELLEINMGEPTRGDFVRSSLKILAGYSNVEPKGQECVSMFLNRHHDFSFRLKDKDDKEKSQIKSEFPKLFTEIIAETYLSFFEEAKIKSEELLSNYLRRDRSNLSGEAS